MGWAAGWLWKQGESKGRWCAGGEWRCVWGSGNVAGARDRERFWLYLHLKFIGRHSKVILSGSVKVFWHLPQRCSAGGLGLPQLLFIWICWWFVSLKTTAHTPKNISKPLNFSYTSMIYENITFLGACTTKIVAPLFLCVCLAFFFWLYSIEQLKSDRKPNERGWRAAQGAQVRQQPQQLIYLFIFLPFVWLYWIEHLKSDRKQDVREGMASQDTTSARGPPFWNLSSTWVTLLLTDSFFSFNICHLSCVCTWQPCWKWNAVSQGDSFTNYNRKYNYLCVLEHVLKPPKSEKLQQIARPWTPNWILCVQQHGEKLCDIITKGWNLRQGCWECHGLQDRNIQSC